MSHALNYLFGGPEPWCADDWTASDDRVRGGKSQSYLRLQDGAACFYGELDTTALGGAGFASQRTASTTKTLALADYDGIELVVSHADDKRYTFILKDTLLPPKSGREQATTSYEFDFAVDSTNAQHAIRIPWSALKPTYRGKPLNDARPIDTASIRQISIMARSFFGSQQGAFSIRLESISAYKRGSTPESRSRV